MLGEGEGPEGELRLLVEIEGLMGRPELERFEFDPP
jgi:hypothetical protein